MGRSAHSGAHASARNLTEFGAEDTRLMIQIITRDNRRLFHHALMEMHRQRKQVFIDRMHWRLSESMGLEIDEFSRGRIDASVAELAEERDAVAELGLI